jgi:hypothetical protein
MDHNKTVKKGEKSRHTAIKSSKRMAPKTTFCTGLGGGAAGCSGKLFINAIPSFLFENPV